MDPYNVEVSPGGAGFFFPRTSRQPFLPPIGYVMQERAGIGTGALFGVR